MCRIQLASGRGHGVLEDPEHVAVGVGDRGGQRAAPDTGSFTVAPAAVTSGRLYLAPLLLVCTARPELFEKHGSWGARTRNAHTINISPLSERETGEPVHGLLEQSVSEQVRQTILERAGGNPLYAEEFVRLVADRGARNCSRSRAGRQRVR